MKFVGGLISAVLVVLFAFYLNRKSADLAYQLSSPISVETTVAGAPPRVVQQIEIANTGNAVAKVQIRIRKPVGVITVTKDSESDKYEQHNVPQGGTELDYESLRPSGRIKISLSGGDPLTEQDLEIRHQEGAARSGLTPEDRLWNWGRAFLVFGTIFFYGYLSARAMAAEWFSHRCRFYPIETLRGKKPIWVSRKMWMEGSEEAVPHAAVRQSGETGDVPSWHIHRLLDSGKPESLPDEVWVKVLPKLIDGFISRLKAAAEPYRWSHPEELQRLLALKKPGAVFDEKWTEFKKELGIRCSLAIVNRAIRFFDFTNQFSALQTAELDQDERQQTRNWLQALYFANLVEKVVGAVDPVEAINRADLNALPKASVDSLRAFADGHRYSRLTYAVRCVAQGIPLDSEAPRGVLLDEWTNLKRIGKEILGARDEYEKKLAELNRKEAEMAGQEAEVETLKAKVLRQLDVINTFINDPAVIDRIEEYDSVFAPGNLLNLRRLAERLRAPPPPTTITK